MTETLHVWPYRGRAVDLGSAQRRFRKLWVASVDTELAVAAEAVWGAITGTLADQTDLDSALSARQPLAQVLTDTTASFTTAQETKLAGIEAGAQVERENIVRLGSDVAVTTTALADVTGLSFAMEANARYLVEFFLIYQSVATTTGIGFAITGPASPVLVAGQEILMDNIGGGGIPRGAFNDYNIVGNLSLAVGVANTNIFGKVDAIVENGATAGDLILRVRSEIADSAVTVKAGSILRWRKTS